MGYNNMGNTYTVSIWVKNEYSGEYNYEHIYGGEWAIVALYALWKCRKLSKCIKLEWRP